MTKTDRERIADEKEIDEMSRMGKLAAQEQAERLEANRILVEEYETLEERRVALSTEFDVLGRLMRAFESEHPDLKHRRYLMTAPDLVEAGIAEPAPNSADASLDDDSATYLKARYGFDLEAAEKDEPSRPKTVPVGMEGAELNPMALDTPCAAQPNRTEEELRANEEAARKVVEAQKSQLGFDSKHLEHFAEPVAVGIPFPDARRTMRETFDADPGFLNTYVANVAMLLHDRHGITEYEAARDILGLIFWDRR